MNRLKDLREDKDLLQKDIAKLINIPTRTYSSYENEERSLPVDMLKALAILHNTSADYIIGLTNEIKPYPRKKGNII